MTDSANVVEDRHFSLSAIMTRSIKICILRLVLEGLPLQSDLGFRFPPEYVRAAQGTSLIVFDVSFL